MQSKQSIKSQMLEADAWNKTFKNPGFYVDMLEKMQVS